MNGLFLAIDLLGVTIAAATAATFVGIVGVAVFQAWLNRAWLVPSLEEHGNNLNSDLSDHKVRIYFRVVVLNRSRRPNRILDVTFEVDEPDSVTLHRAQASRGEPRGFHVSAWVNGERSDFPIEVPAPAAVRFLGDITLPESDPWRGGQLRGKVIILDIHGTRHAIPADYAVPAEPLRPPKRGKGATGA